MRSQGWGNDTTGVEDDVAGVGDDGRARREWRMRWQGWGSDADGFTVCGWICRARGNETDTSNGTWVWKVLRIWDTIGIILI